ncbi:MAG: class I SAM-dependent methyltransferase [Acidimicrobiia bacterium]
MPWTDAAGWWLDEIAGDPAYEEVVTPLLLDLLVPERDHLYLDLGCGEGRVMRRVAATGARVHGIDLSFLLADHAGATMADLGSLPFRDRAFDGVYAVLVVEHVADHQGLFAEAARVTRPGGVMAVVSNHPVWTAPGSTPISDSEETLWRPGDYFSQGVTAVSAGETTITFHHRPLAELLTVAAEAGWSLERMVELPHHEIEDQAGIPRLLGVRWRLLP